MLMENAHAALGSVLPEVQFRDLAFRDSSRRTNRPLGRDDPKAAISIQGFEAGLPQL